MIIADFKDHVLLDDASAKMDRLGKPKTGEGGDCMIAAYIRSNGEFEYRDSRKIDFVVF